MGAEVFRARKSPAVQAGLLIGYCGKSLHLCHTVFDQTVGAISGYAVLDQTVGAISGYAVLDQTVGAISGHPVFDQTIRAISGHAVFDQTVGAISGYAVLDQAIRTPFSHTAFNQSIRAAFSDHRLSRGSGKSVNCKNRESDAEKGLAFHDGVLRVLLVGMERMLVPRIFYENFIDVMVNIDSIDRRNSRPHAGVMVQSSDGTGRVDRRFYTG